MRHFFPFKIVISDWAVRDINSFSFLRLVTVVVLYNPECRQTLPDIGSHPPPTPSKQNSMFSTDSCIWVDWRVTVGYGSCVFSPKEHVAVDSANPVFSLQCFSASFITWLITVNVLSWKVINYYFSFFFSLAPVRMLKKKKAKLCLLFVRFLTFFYDTLCLFLIIMHSWTAEVWAGHVHGIFFFFQ